MSPMNAPMKLQWQVSSEPSSSDGPCFADQKFARTALSGAVCPPAALRRPDPGRSANPGPGLDYKRIGRVGALAVMLGVGAALLAAPGLASADKADSGSPRSSADGTQGSTTNPSSASSGKADDRDERRPSWSNAGKKGPNGAGSGGASNGAGSGGSASNGAGAGGSASNRDRDDVADDDSRGNKPGRDDTDADTASVADADQSPNRGSDTAGSSPTPAESRADVEISVPPADTPHQPAAPAQGALLLTTAASSSVRRTDDGDAEGAGAADTTARGGPLSTTSPSTSTLTSTTSPVVSTNTATTTVTAQPQDEVIEAESMAISRTRNGATYADPAASGGAAVVLNKNSSVSTTTALAEFTSLVIRAKGDQYLGAPKMRVSVNGSVVTTVAVAASTWTDYTIDYSGSAGTYTITVAFTNDLYSRKYGDRNLRLDSITAVAAVVEPPPPPDTSGPGYFGNAGWLWNPIGANPVIDPNSATWVSYLAASDAQRIANLYDYSVALVSASEITSTTPRYDVTLTQPWGSDPFGSTTVPIPAGTTVPPGSDGHLAILDPTTGTAYGIWQAAYDSTTDTWSGSWGGMTDLNGNGIDETGSATAAAIARYAGVVTAEEFSAAIAANSGLNHALAFSTDLAGPDFVYPAIKSDGQNWAGVATPIPEGYRIQLDPTIDVDAIPGITAGEKVIAKTLQTHGAYVVDQGGARMAFAFELVDDASSSSPGSVWTDAGFSWDYYDMNKIPWTSLRVLAPATVVL